MTRRLFLSLVLVLLLPAQAALVEDVHAELLTDAAIGDSVTLYITYQTNNLNVVEFRIVNNTNQPFWIRAEDNIQGISDEITVEPRTQETYNVPPGRYRYQVDEQGNLIMGDLRIFTKWPAE